MKYPVLILLGILLFSCREDFPKKYAVKESYEVIAGAETGLSGTSEYTISILPGMQTNEFEVDNFAKNFKIKIVIEKGSFIIPAQSFFLNNNKFTLSGKGSFRGDSLFYEYLSAGPRGQITARCTGAKL
jgi:hypothetical protein